jgi:hypothetical protein
VLVAKFVPAVRIRVILLSMSLVPTMQAAQSPASRLYSITDPGEILEARANPNRRTVSNCSAIPRRRATPGRSQPKRRESGGTGISSENARMGRRN